jgi:Mg-chelatase subunit ChlD
MDPETTNSGGAEWFDNPTGQQLYSETLYSGQSEKLSFTKAAGLGDVEVLCPPIALPPTATLPPTPASALTATSTATMTPSATPTRAATNTPTRVSTATATRRPRPIYLPLALSESCARRTVRADVVLAIDMSTSMRHRTGDGRPKQDAVLAAGRAFLDQMSLAADSQGHRDQVAIVGFNERAWIEQELTDDRAAVGAALDRLPKGIAEGTRLDLAIDRGAEALSGPARRAGNTAVMVLLTDGMPNRVPTPAPAGSQEDTVLAAAGRAKAAGIRVYTIGVGLPNAADPSAQINPDLLRRIASEPRMYFQTWSASELAAIYREIAYTIGCPPESFWGRR